MRAMDDEMSERFDIERATAEAIAAWLEAHARLDKTPEQAKILRDAAVGVRKFWWKQPIIQ